MANEECKKTIKQIPLYIDNVLSDKETEEVIKHLDKCPRCRDEYNYLKAIIDTAKKIPEKEVPEDFHKNLMEKVKAESHKKKKPYITLRQISAGVAAAAVIAISFVALGEISESEKTQLSDEYLTSRLSDAPIQKDKIPDKQSDYSDAVQEKDVNKSEKKTSSASQNAAIEEKEMPKEEPIPVGISLDEETSIYKTATVTVTEENRDEVLKILSEFKQDEIGYIVENIEEIINKIKEIGANVKITNDSASIQNYILIK